jgi:hypothetical protein
MQGSSVDAHAMNAQRVFALQRTSFDQLFDAAIDRMASS